MKREFYTKNRIRLFEKLPENSVAVLFSGSEIVKTADEAYPFFADREFVYLTGITQKQSVLVLVKEGSTSLHEILYLLPPDMMAERWTGKRLSGAQAESVSGISDIRSTECFEAEMKLLLAASVKTLFLSTFKAKPTDRDREAQYYQKTAESLRPDLKIGDLNALIRELRLIKSPEEIEALREAERITKEGILAMMHRSHDGMYEYQYKAEFDRAISQYGPAMHGFPPIISAGQNNFIIHYYEYTGQAHDGDLVLNDVGVNFDGLICDVSRAWPVNGKFTELQKRMFDCALQTSNRMFQMIRPGMKMADVDAGNRAYCAELLTDIGVLKDPSEVGRVMWHGGAHHIGFDVHDVVKMPEFIAPGMTFCVDIGIYDEESGIGFRLEDNCLVTETGAENLSAAIPRTTEDIESEMRRGLR